MDIYTIMSLVAKAVRGLETRVDANKSQALRAWLTTQGLKKRDLDRLIASGYLSPVSIEKAITNSTPGPKKKVKRQRVTAK